jgi:hypothetical protein
MGDDTPREPFDPADYGYDVSKIPPPPPFISDPELIGDMEKPPREYREARARHRKEKWDHRLRWFRRRQHAA